MKYRIEFDSMKIKVPGMLWGASTEIKQVF